MTHLPLTPREKQVLALIAEGLSSKEIGERLGTSSKTCDCQKQAIRIKLGCKNQRELMIAAIRMEGEV